MAAATRSARDCWRSSVRSAFATRRFRNRPSSARASARRCGGMRPIVEVMTVNFSLLALDQILNNAATILHMSGGQFNVPLVIRMATGGGTPGGGTAFAQPGRLVRAHPRHQGADSGHARRCARHAVRPRSRIRTRCSSSKTPALYNMEGQLPRRCRAVDIDHALRAPPGPRRDHHHLQRQPVEGAGRRRHILASDGIEAEVIDLRTLRPLDDDVFSTRSPKPTAR